MINARINIEGTVNVRGNIEGTVNASTVKVYPNLENLEITPSKEEQTYKSNDYYGYDEVKVNAVSSAVDSNITPENIKEGVNILGTDGTLKGLNATEITINPTNEEQVITPEEPYNAFDKVTVGAQSGIDPNLYFETYIGGSGYTPYNFGSQYAIKKMPPLTIDESVTNLGYLFSMLYNLEEQPQGVKEASSRATNMDYMFQYVKAIKEVSLDCTSMQFASNMFSGCEALETVDLTDTPNLIDATNMFNGCSVLKTINGFNTSTVETLQNTFKGCKAIEEFDLDCSSAKNMANAFQNCINLKKVTLRNTSNVQNISYILGGATNLEEVGEIDASSITNAQYLFQINKTKFTTFGGLKDYGKAFDPTRSANYSYYTLMLTTCPNLSYESLLNVVNKVYDIASLGVATQKINMGASLKAKLTATEEGQQAIANAEAKGWTVV